MQTIQTLKFTQKICEKTFRELFWAQNKNSERILGVLLFYISFISFVSVVKNSLCLFLGARKRSHGNDRDLWSNADL